MSERITRLRNSAITAQVAQEGGDAQLRAVALEGMTDEDWPALSGALLAMCGNLIGMLAHQLGVEREDMWAAIQQSMRDLDLP